MPFFKNKNAGISQSVESFLFIRRYTVEETKGIFTERELRAILDTFEDVLIDYQQMADNKLWGSDSMNASHKNKLSRIDVDPEYL